ncbi:uncharacterized protein SOCEGT47_033140 [Sorangium cellulosum]|uniref:Uncharacterized protein n=1 Tax=Sorangium cellulosum TaxID=56 RepID=A0A4V0NDI6_SORCE|nr:uncharacterized protein SOCEGT47_033140 [Sorangium cellulosum]
MSGSRRLGRWQWGQGRPPRREPITALLRAALFAYAGRALARSAYPAKLGRGSSILKSSMDAMVPPKMTSAIENASPRTESRPEMADSIVAIMSS